VTLVFGFATRGYKDGKAQYWEAVEILRTLVSVSIGVAINEARSGQLLAAGIWAIASLWFYSHCAPWKVRLLYLMWCSSLL
jgi:hypothetical protein